jgi:dTDP-4-dehydrorhamnose 3,5-epimerase
VKLVSAALAGVFVIEPEPVSDERGWFARVFDADQFAAAGLDPQVVQCSLSRNPLARTLRGLHYQEAPHGETKLVRCTRGRLFDVAVDLRPGSPTFRRWTGLELSAESGLGLVIPPGCAHGFLTLEDDTDVMYQMSATHQSAVSRGLRWDDPGVSIAWPAEPAVISPRDHEYPDHDWTAPPSA